MSRAPGGRRARLPARPADDGARRRRRRSSSPGPTTEDELVELLAWADASGLAVGGGRLGLEPAGRRRRRPRPGDEARRRARARSSATATRVVCGGGARLPSAAAKAAGWGLTGLEFGINIPGTVGGAVRMNANAYGGELARVLEWVDVCTAAGVERRRPDELGFAYRRSDLGPGEVVSRASFALSRAEPAAVKATLAEMRAQAPRGAAVRDQDLRLDLQEPRRRRAPRAAPPGSCSRRRAVSGLDGRRRPLLAQARELRRERRRGDDRRRARGDGRGPPARPRALRGRARARGPGARRGRVARRLGAGTRALRAGGRARGVN